MWLVYIGIACVFVFLSQLSGLPQVKWKKEWMNERKNGRINEWTNEQKKFQCLKRKWLIPQPFSWRQNLAWTRSISSSSFFDHPSTTENDAIKKALTEIITLKRAKKKIQIETKNIDSTILGSYKVQLVFVCHLPIFLSYYVYLYLSLFILILSFLQGVSRQNRQKETLYLVLWLL